MQDSIEQKGKCKVYNIKFRNLTDLYDYLKSNPKVNTKVFTRQASIKNDTLFAGEPLPQAIEYCIGGYDKGFDNFLSTNAQLKTAAKELTDNRTLVRTIYGGIPQPALVAAGVPDCMLRYERDTTTAVRNIYFNLAYSAQNTTGKIVNRGLATLYLVQALESKGEIVNFKAFELSKNDDEDEIINIELNLKKPGDLFLNIEKCYYPIKSKEFLRRVLFRVKESSKVEDYYWGDGYGQALTASEMRTFLGAKPHDLVISCPEEMGIEGNNIYDDTVALIQTLGIEKEFDVPKILSLKEKNSTRKF